MISESVLPLRGDTASLETRPESIYSQEMSQISICGFKEEIYSENTYVWAQGICTAVRKDDRGNATTALLRMSSQHIKHR